MIAQICCKFNANSSFFVNFILFHPPWICDPQILDHIGTFGGFARVSLPAPGFSRVYFRDPFIMTLGIHLFFPSLSWCLFLHVPSIRRTNRTNSSGACFWLMAATWVAINTAMDTTSKRCRYCLRFQYLDPIGIHSKAGKSRLSRFITMISWKRESRWWHWLQPHYGYRDCDRHVTSSWFTS